VVRSLLAFAALCAAVPVAAAERAYIAIQTADIAVAERWYSATFQLKRVNRFDRPRFDQRILSGPDLIVEIVQMKPPLAKPVPEGIGIVKAGVELRDFDRLVKAWRERGVAPANGLVFDEALGRASIQLTDPDGNLLQVFGKSAGPFDSTIRIDPAVSKAD
jgi:catechol 2,3-dioxygenase-like lactoylglutathione lyase family enzyme